MGEFSHKASHSTIEFEKGFCLCASSHRGSACAREILLTESPTESGRQVRAQSANQSVAVGGAILAALLKFNDTSSRDVVSAVARMAEFGHDVVRVCPP